MSEPTIAAIPSEYNGITFRSRLEARWAMFLDACNIPWKYEHEGYDIAGLKYVPDFYLTKTGNFIEVKGDPNADLIKPMVLALAKTCGVTVVHGCISDRRATVFVPGGPNDKDVALLRIEGRIFPCRSCAGFFVRDTDDLRMFCLVCGQRQDWLESEIRRIEAHSFWNPPAVPSVPSSTGLRDRLRGGTRGAHLQVVSQPEEWTFDLDVFDRDLDDVRAWNDDLSERVAREQLVTRLLGRTDFPPILGQRVMSPKLGEGVVVSVIPREGDAELGVVFARTGKKMRLLQSLAALEVMG